MLIAPYFLFAWTEGLGTLFLKNPYMFTILNIHKKINKTFGFYSKHFMCIIVLLWVLVYLFVVLT